MTSPSEATIGRRLIRSQASGVLSTMSSELPGYPFGSVTPYVMTHEGELVVYVSSIAQHTRNMKADPKVSLTVLEEGAGNQQALGRVTVVGDAVVVPDVARERVSGRYFRLFPDAREYAGTHDFSFFSIEPRRVRFIGGFGRIFWIEASEWRQPTPQWSSDEERILEHMNTDHRAALATIAVDPEGAHVQRGESVHYVPFSAPAFDADALRSALIELAERGPDATTPRS